MKNLLLIALGANLLTACITPQDKALWEETKTMLSSSDAPADTNAVEKKAE